MTTQQPAAESVLTAFDTVNLVALAERHWARQDSDFRIALVQIPAFARKVNDIIVEFANPVARGLSTSGARGPH